MRKRARRLSGIVSALIITAFLCGYAYPQAYELSKLCICRGNPGLKKMVYAGMIERLVDGYANDWEQWSSSMLKPDGKAPERLPRERDEIGASLDAYDRWSCRYSAYGIVDNDPATAWVEGAPGDGIGEMVVIRIKKHQPLAIWGGLGALEKLFRANNRPRRIRVYIFQADRLSGRDVHQGGVIHRNLLLINKHEIELKDINGYQPLPLPNHAFKENRGEAFAAIEILSVYPGNKHRDTCISEVRIDIDTKNASSRIRKLIEAQKRERIFKASWGAGPGQLGRTRNNAYSYNVPRGFTLDDTGALFILDQVNSRIQVFDAGGEYRKAIPLMSSEFHDIDAGLAGNLFLLHKGLDPASLKGTGSVILIDDTGRERKRIGLIGKGIQNVNAVHGIYRSRDGLWTDIYGDQVRLCDPSGVEGADRLILKKAGRITHDEKSVFPVMDLRGKTLGFQRSTKDYSAVKIFRVDFADPMFGAAVLDTDINGYIHLVSTRLVEENGPPYGLDEYHQVFVIIDVDGNEKRRIYMPVSAWGLDNHRPYRITQEGVVYHLVFDENGAVMWRYAP